MTLNPFQSLMKHFSLPQPIILHSDSSTVQPREPKLLTFHNVYGLSEDDINALKKIHPTKRKPTLVQWSKTKNIVHVAVGNGFHIYTVTTNHDEFLCSGFIREIQTQFLSQSLLLSVVPEEVFVLCFEYFGGCHFEYWASGRNEDGECGVGHTTQTVIFEQIKGMENVSKICVNKNGSNVFWLKRDGTVWANGPSHGNKLGLTTKEMDEMLTTPDHYEMNEIVHTPMLLSFCGEHPGLKCVDAASYWNYNVIICDDGSVWAAGHYPYKLAGYDTLNHWLTQKGAQFVRITAVEKHHVVSVSITGKHPQRVLFLTQNGSVYMFIHKNPMNPMMNSSAPILEQIQIHDENGMIDEAVSIESFKGGRKWQHVLALDTNQRVYEFKEIKRGQHWIHVFQRMAAFSQKVIKKIDCGSSHCGCLTEENELYLWGNNECGQCMASETEIVCKPIRIRSDRLIIDFFLGEKSTMLLLGLN